MISFASFPGWVRSVAPEFRRVREVAALLLLALAAAAARAEMPATHPLDGIRTAAIAALGATDAQAEAALDPALRLTRCSQPLQAIASGPKTALVRCADSPGWRLYVPVRVHREADVVVLASPAAAGIPITANQLQIQRRDIGSASGATFSASDSLVGRIPNRALAAGMVPTESDLSIGTPLRRGDPVTLVARAGGVEVRMQGRALGPAQAGGRVTVENTESHRVLRGRVAGEGLVEIVP